MQSEEDKKQKPNNQSLQIIRARVSGRYKGNVGLDGNIYQLAKELGCLGDLIGREYVIVRDESGQIIGFRQKPVRVATLLTLFKEAQKDAERQEAEMKKNKGKRYGR